jgi:hypothetical protein
MCGNSLLRIHRPDRSNENKKDKTDKMNKELQNFSSAGALC